MDKKIILILAVLLIGASFFVAYKFYAENQTLSAQNQELTKSNGQLTAEKKGLEDKAQKLEADLKGIQDRSDGMQAELTRVNHVAADLKQKYDEASNARDLFQQKLIDMQTTQAPKPVEVPKEMPQPPAGYTPSGSAPTDEYWADFVKTRAELEAKLESLNKDLSDARMNAAELGKRNKELSLQLDELSKERAEVQQQLEFKTRTVEVMSRDLVKERESRKSALEELDKLRQDSVSLKREMVMVNREKVQLQGDLNKAVDKKDELEKMMGAVENTFRDKRMVIEELQQQLSDAIGDKKAVGPGAAASSAVALPPIVVKPEASGVQGVQGSIIAVNPEEKFVVVDKGMAAGMRPGMSLTILRTGNEIAKAEVVEVRKDISAADIKEVKNGATVQEGDIAVTR
jgi:peptidoglycan hydrolase CwlO-like protein